MPPQLPSPARLRWITGEARRILRYQGLPVLLWRGLVKGLSPVVALKLVSLYQKDLTQPLPEVRARIEMAIEQAREADVDRILDMGVGDDPTVHLTPDRRLRLLDRQLRDFREGGLCFVARVGSELVHSNWIRFRGVEVVPGRHLRLGPGEAYMTDGFTVKRWRGHGIHAAVNVHMLRYLQQAGYRRAYTYALAENLISRRGLHRAGWELTGVLLAVSFLGRGPLVRALRGDLHPWVEDQPAKAP